MTIQRHLSEQAQDTTAPDTLGECLAPVCHMWTRPLLPACPSTRASRPICVAESADYSRVGVPGLKRGILSLVHYIHTNAECAFQAEQPLLRRSDIVQRHHLRQSR
eukprot:COSAG02_NODE_5479_length_4291_cov_5.207777_4_plen_106_part_00